MLKNISLDIHSGEKVALVGPSGAGKSTIVKLLAKQLQPQQGGIRVDGIPTRNIPAQQLLERIAVVPQSVDLFNDSLEHNIFLDMPHSKRTLAEALRLSHSSEFVSRLPHKEKTIVGERGVKLSGGQKQRVAIARAIIRKPQLLIFDEATSNLDAISEREISLAMQDIFKNKTALIIAHRMATVFSCDRVIVLEKGRVVEEGSPKKLLRKKGHFARLVQLQKID